MSDNVYYLTPPPKPITQAVRVEFHHKATERLWREGKIKARRFIFSASNVERQREFLKSLIRDGCEVVLDTNVAELSVPGKASSSLRAVKWAQKERLLEKADMAPGTNHSVIEPIARFAVENGFTVVMAPAHFLRGDFNGLLKLDFKAVEDLRLALDQAGGQNIEIDFPFIVDAKNYYSLVSEFGVVNSLKNLPINQIWVRASGFGWKATGVGIAKYIEASWALGGAGLPIIADYAGGLPAIAASAFGGVSGFCHGVSTLRQFNASNWFKPYKKNDGGSSPRIYLSGIDGTISIDDYREIVDKSSTARRIFVCSDKFCCGSLEKMIADPWGHDMNRTGEILGSLSMVPESLRIDAFFSNDLEERLEKANGFARIKRVDEGIKKKVEEKILRLRRIEGALKALHKRNGVQDSAKQAKFRSSNVGGIVSVHRETR